LLKGEKQMIHSLSVVLQWWSSLPGQGSEWVFGCSPCILVVKEIHYMKIHPAVYFCPLYLSILRLKFHINSSWINVYY
jgi:hypothetical protein